MIYIYFIFISSIKLSNLIIIHIFSSSVHSTDRDLLVNQQFSLVTMCVRSIMLPSHHHKVKKIIPPICGKNFLISILFSFLFRGHCRSQCYFTQRRYPDTTNNTRHDRTICNKASFSGIGWLSFWRDSNTIEWPSTSYCVAREVNIPGVCLGPGKLSRTAPSHNCSMDNNVLRFGPGVCGFFLVERGVSRMFQNLPAQEAHISASFPPPTAGQLFQLNCQ